ncbi:hypothetical protein I312_101410 [Cryptococcus bacillisporus CA1280]|uniref:uncharacterized protein n=1 Tax=Cryptococcus bacillisporus CA1280 TaxID=1296109 RepID=UPI0033688645
MALPNLRSIFASSRTSEEERQLSRTTFYKFTAFVGACLREVLWAWYRGRPANLCKKRKRDNPFKEERATGPRLLLSSETVS